MSGTYDRYTSSWVKSKPRYSWHTYPEMKFRWVNIACLGSPVVPEVVPRINIESDLGSCFAGKSWIFKPSLTKSLNEYMFRSTIDARVN